MSQQEKFIRVYTIQRNGVNVLVVESTNEFFNNVVNGILFLINAFDRVKMSVEEFQRATSNFNKFVEDFIKKIHEEFQRVFMMNK